MEDNIRRKAFTEELRENWRTIVINDHNLSRLLREFGGTVDFKMSNGYHWQLSVNPKYKNFRLELWDENTFPRESGFFEDWRAEPIRKRPIPMEPGVIILPKGTDTTPAWHSLEDYRMMKKLGIDSLYIGMQKNLDICERHHDNPDGYCHSDIFMISADGKVSELCSRAEGKHRIQIPEDTVILLSDYTNEKTKQRTTACYCANTQYFKIHSYTYQLRCWLKKIKS